MAAAQASTTTAAMGGRGRRMGRRAGAAALGGRGRREDVEVDGAASEGEGGLSALYCSKKRRAMGGRERGRHGLW